MVSFKDHSIGEKLTFRLPDMELPASHPKKAFIRRIIELETRLAYHDRILDSLPEPMTKPASGVMPVAPEPVWPYEKEGESNFKS